MRSASHRCTSSASSGKGLKMQMAAALSYSLSYLTGVEDTGTHLSQWHFLIIILMSATEEGPQAASPKSTEKEQQCVIKRVADLPLVSSTYEIVSATYNSAKGSHPAIQAVCDMAEVGVKTIASSAVSGAQPLLNKLEPQIASANTYACQGLDKLQETLPVVQQTIEKVVSDAKGLVTSAKGSVCTRVSKARDTVSSVVDVVKEAAQESMKMARSAMMSGMDTMMEINMREMLVDGIDQMIEISEDMIDYYLPVTDEELAAIAASVVVRVPEEDPLEEEKKEERMEEEEGYYERLGSLSALLRHRSYQSSLAKIQRIKRGAQEVLFQLQEAILLVKYTMQSLDRQFNPKANARRKEMEPVFLEWNGGQPGPRETSEESWLEIASQALNLSRSVIQQMQTICQRLLANMQGLPAALQGKVQQAYSSMEELQAALSSAKSLKDLPSGGLKQSQEKIEKAHEAICEVMEYVMLRTPFTWVAGSFSPAGTSAVELEEEAKVEA
ncbi:perilipin-3-like isoform X2 [Rhineura floridana]|uniref:perilipin-3-like isoform X2 n=1 Tax=Rhineura floridana TaxID=261503 RepID=UPI002AC81552|nr:perilipin-3-like isoform X2 [Rhineura floridana]